MDQRRDQIDIYLSSEVRNAKSVDFLSHHRLNESINYNINTIDSVLLLKNNLGKLLIFYYSYQTYKL